MKQYDKIYVPINGGERIPEEDDEVHAILNLGDVDMVDTGTFANKDVFNGNSI